MSKFIFALSFCFLLFACDNAKVYEAYSSYENQWHMDSIADFAFTIDDTESKYKVLINTRNLEDYPYSNLWLFLNLMAPDSTLRTDTVEIQLAHPSGKWTGKGAGGIYLNQYTYRSNVYFPVEGSYTISLQQGMREEKLDGIRDVGIRIEKAK